MISEPAIVFEDCGVPGHWRVEKFDEGGGCEVEIFTGPHARGAAVRYAAQLWHDLRVAAPENAPAGRWRAGGMIFEIVIAILIAHFVLRVLIPVISKLVVLAIFVALAAALVHVFQ